MPRACSGRVAGRLHLGYTEVNNCSHVGAGGRRFFGTGATFRDVRLVWTQTKGSNRMRRRDEKEYVDFATASEARLRRTAYLICGDWEQASDIVQEALIRVYVAWPRIEHKGGVNSFARRCVVNVAIDMGRRRSSTELPTPHEAMDRPTGPAHDVADRAALVDALRELAPRQRACVVLRYFEDLSVSDTARALGTSEGTVKSQTARALDSLRRHPHLQDVLTEGALS
jgi:RNA polymerase sigma-70 factor (sigma-E family)